MAKINPVFSAIQADEYIENAASKRGVAFKTFALLGIAVLCGILSISFPAFFTQPMVWLCIGIGAIVAAMVGQFNPNAAPVASVVYACCEGFMLGLVSFIFEASIGGIVLTAVVITATIFSVMLLLYSTNILRATSRFVRGMSAIAITIMVSGLVFFIAYLFNPTNIMMTALAAHPGIFLLVCVLDVIYAAFMLIMDFENINAVIAGGFDKKYEWSAALGLMLTLVWIYVEVLRILTIIASLISDNN